MISYRTQLLPTTHYRPGERTACKPDHLKLLDIVITCAREGKRCPPNDALVDRLQLLNRRTAVGLLFDKLVQEGLVHFHVSGFGRVVYVIDLGLCTARPAGGKNKAAIEAWYRGIAA